MEVGFPPMPSSISTPLSKGPLSSTQFIGLPPLSSGLFCPSSKVNLPLNSSPSMLWLPPQASFAFWSSTIWIQFLGWYLVHFCWEHQIRFVSPKPWLFRLSTIIGWRWVQTLASSCLRRLETGFWCIWWGCGWISHWTCCFMGSGWWI